VSKQKHVTQHTEVRKKRREKERKREREREGSCKKATLAEEKKNQRKETNY